MSQVLFVKPGKGLKVVDPVTGEALPDLGAEVSHSPYWLRRLRDGDVTQASPAKARNKSKERST